MDTLHLRKDVQQIFIETPKKTQVMIHCATMTETRALCSKFMQDRTRSVWTRWKLTLHGLLQHARLNEKMKKRRLHDLLDAHGFKQRDVREVGAAGHRV